MLYEKQYFIAAIITLLSTWCILPCFGHNGQCIKGKYHKDKPSQETEEYKFCTPWKNLTCCTTLLDNEVDQGDAPKQYNDTWHLCGNLSPECLKYWKRQVYFIICCLISDLCTIFSGWFNCLGSAKLCWDTVVSGAFRSHGGSCPCQGCREARVHSM